MQLLVLLYKIDKIEPVFEWKIKSIKYKWNILQSQLYDNFKLHIYVKNTLRNIFLQQVFGRHAKCKFWV